MTLLLKLTELHFDFKMKFIKSCLKVYDLIKDLEAQLQVQKTYPLMDTMSSSNPPKSSLKNCFEGTIFEDSNSKTKLCYDIIFIVIW